jgi:exodeoxyribonuclease VII small subunit
MPTKKSDYATLSRELDEVMAKLQHDDITVDEAITAYERGMQLIAELQAYLQEAENKVQKIKADFEKG